MTSPPISAPSRPFPLRLEAHPARRTVPPRLEARGEIYMTSRQSSSASTPSARRKAQPLFANPRNATAGTLKLLDPRQCAKRRSQRVLLRPRRLRGGRRDTLPARDPRDLRRPRPSRSIPTTPSAPPWTTFSSSRAKWADKRHELALPDRRPRHQGRLARPPAPPRPHRQGAALHDRLQVPRRAGRSPASSTSRPRSARPASSRPSPTSSPCSSPARPSSAPACTTSTRSSAKTSASATRWSSKRPARSSRR